ncbi:hypothetical protein GLYMA_06G095451v4 [Glycine max]|nr:hypothetical protein GLYMA_06G095451v4 [Glycine max]
MCVQIGKPPQIDISALRENYISPEFLEEQVEVDPINQFHKWFDDALAAGLKEPNAMALSTVGKDGKPSSRMVLLKGLDKDRFVWYGWKGLFRKSLMRNQNSISIAVLEESQIGAIVSKQSTVVHVLYQEYKELEEKYLMGKLLNIYF